MLFAVCLAICASAQAQEEDQSDAKRLEGRAGLNFYSAHVWRGRVVNDGAVYQPAVTVWYEPVSVDMRGTWDWTPDDDTAARTRVDLSVDYSFVWRKFMFKAGVVTYIYNDTPDASSSDTYEWYFDTMMDVQFSPSLIIFYDTGEIEAPYAVFSVGESYSLTETVDLDMRARVGAGTSGFNSRFYGVSLGVDDEGNPVEPGGGLVDAGLSILFPITTSEAFCLTPGLEYLTVLNQDLRDVLAVADVQTDNLVLSVSAMWSF